MGALVHAYIRSLFRQLHLVSQLRIFPHPLQCRDRLPKQTLRRHLPQPLGQTLSYLHMASGPGRHGFLRILRPAAEAGLRGHHPGADLALPARGYIRLTAFGNAGAAKEAMERIRAVL